MKTLKKAVLALTGSTVAALLIASGAQATPVTPVYAAPDNGERVSITVPYADLNLNSAAGQAALEGRIAQAARSVCGPTEYGRAGSVRDASRNMRCRKEAVSKAMSQINAHRVASTN